MMKRSMEVQLWSLGSTLTELPIAVLSDISIYIVFVASGCWKQPSAKLLVSNLAGRCSLFTTSDHILAVRAFLK